jgi:hypothetical protein
VVTQDFSPALDSSTTGCYQGLRFSSTIATQSGGDFYIAPQQKICMGDYQSPAGGH